MRELQVKLCFTKHCLGHVKKLHWEGSKRRATFLMPRNPVTKKVTFLPTWWQAVLARAAKVENRHQSTVDGIRFSPELTGDPKPIPENYYRVYYSPTRFHKHEAFYPGDTVGVTCLVPEAISDNDFRKLLELAGRYYGISPARPNHYGFFLVTSIGPIEDGSKD